MEVLGGNGYVEEGPMPRLYREAPVNSIWEGSGNIMCLDVLRALGRAPEGREAVRAELAASRGGDARFDRFAERLDGELEQPNEVAARRFTERLVLALQAALLIKNAPATIADAFCASRLADDWGHAFGTLPDGIDRGAIVDRAMPSG
jgi:putative acyl-CoA dehydrogenase